MRNLIILIALCVAYNAFSADELIDMRGKSIWERSQLMEKARLESAQSKTVSDQSAQFLSNLKDKGVEGLEDSRTMLTGDREMTSWINKEAGRPDQGNTFKELSGDMLAKGGKIKEFRKVGQDEEILNGNMVKTRYSIEYENGKTRTLEFMYVKPTITGGHHLMEVNSLD